MRQIFLPTQRQGQSITNTKPNPNPTIRRYYIYLRRSITFRLRRDRHCDLLEWRSSEKADELRRENGMSSKYADSAKPKRLAPGDRDGSKQDSSVVELRRPGGPHTATVSSEVSCCDGGSGRGMLRGRSTDRLSSLDICSTAHNIHPFILSWIKWFRFHKHTRVSSSSNNLI